MTRVAADITFAVFVFVHTSRKIAAAGVYAIMRAGIEMMFCVYIVSAFVADAVIHTNMLTIVKKGTAIDAAEGVISGVIIPGCMFVTAIELIKATEITYVSDSVMGFHITKGD